MQDEAIARVLLTQPLVDLLLFPESLQLRLPHSSIRALARGRADEDRDTRGTGTSPQTSRDATSGGLGPRW